MLGVGGGVILVPGLLLIAGLEFRNAVAASLICVVATSVASSIVFVRRGIADLPLATELQFFTVSGAVGGGLVAAHIPPAPLYLVFAVLLTYLAIRMWPGTKPMDDKGDDGAAPERRTQAAAGSIGAGLASGLLGIGGGVLNIPVLHLLLGRTFDEAIPTSAYMIGLTAAAGALVYLVRGDVPTHAVGLAMIGTLAGARIAALVRDRFDQRSLKILFVFVLLYGAYRMGTRGVAQF